MNYVYSRVGLTNFMAAGNVYTEKSSHSSPTNTRRETMVTGPSKINATIRVTSTVNLHSNLGIDLSKLPVPKAFSETEFYGDRHILKYRWFFTPNKTKHFDLNHRFLKGTAKACTSNEKHELVILVLTIHNMTSQRQAIRDTWGSVTKLGTWPRSSEKYSVKLLFVLGVSKNASLNAAVTKEAETGDLIIADFEDSYFNLTRKVLIGFKWVVEFCPTAKYVMKTDEDNYLNVEQFAEVMRSRSWDDQIYGAYFRTSFVERLGKYAVSKESYPLSVYPPHVKGILYFMPFSVALRILAVSEYIPYVNIEDVHITGILPKLFDVRHVGLSAGLYYHFSSATPCQLVDGTKMLSKDIFNRTFYEIWERVKNPSLCSNVHRKPL